MQSGSVSFLHRMNKRLVFNLINQHKQITQPELSKLTGLKPPTINNIVARLVKDGLVTNCGKGEGSTFGGPRPNQYCLNKDSRYFIGLDIGINAIVGVAVNMGSDILATDCIHHVIATQEQLTQNILCMVERISKQAGIGIDGVERIGISMAALIDLDNGVVLSSYSQTLENYKFRESLYPDIKAPIYVDNDINIIASGQRLQIDKMKELKNVVCIGIREGIGVGIIIDGQIYRGQRGLSCNLAGFPHAENCASMIRRIQNARKADPVGSDRQDPDTMDVNDLYRAVRDDPGTVTIVNESFVNIGRFAGMMVQLMCPDGLIVAGEIFNYNHSFFHTLVDSCKGSILTVPAPETAYYEMPLKSNSIAYCAALCAMDSFFNSDATFD